MCTTSCVYKQPIGGFYTRDHANPGWCPNYYDRDRYGRCALISKVIGDGTFSWSFGSSQGGPNPDWDYDLGHNFMQFFRYVRAMFSLESARQWISQVYYNAVTDMGQGSVNSMVTVLAILFSFALYNLKFVFVTLVRNSFILMIHIAMVTPWVPILFFFI